MANSEHLIFSIVICTQNRAELLKLVLKSFFDCDYQSILFETIIVDNGSTDETKNVAKSFEQKINNIHYFFEEKQGLSHARNRGWKEARGEYVGFLDDDCKVSVDWLQVAQEIGQNIKPAAFGGPFYAFFLSPKPFWYKDAYGSLVQSTEAKYVSENEYLVGGNMFIRRTILEKLGGFDPDFGMNGKRIGYGEETALLEKIRNQPTDNCLYYDPRLWIEHLVRPEKMTWKWILRHKFADGRDYYNLFPDKKIQISVFRIIYRILKNIWLLFLDILFRVYFRDREKYPYSQNYYYEQTTKHIAAFGEIAEQLREKLHYARK
jgi:glucosyl-dolichyl phosphate glucuronosyltransferase